MSGEPELMEICELCEMDFRTLDELMAHLYGHLKERMVVAGLIPELKQRPGDGFGEPVEDGPTGRQT